MGAGCTTCKGVSNVIVSGKSISISESNSYRPSKIKGTSGVLGTSDDVQMRQSLEEVCGRIQEVKEDFLKSNATNGSSPVSRKVLLGKPASKSSKSPKRTQASFVSLDVLHDLMEVMEIGASYGWEGLFTAVRGICRHVFGVQNANFFVIAESDTHLVTILDDNREVRVPMPTGEIKRVIDGQTIFKMTQPTKRCSWVTVEGTPCTQVRDYVCIPATTSSTGRVVGILELFSWSETASPGVVERMNSNSLLNKLLPTQGQQDHEILSVLADMTALSLTYVLKSEHDLVTMLRMNVLVEASQQLLSVVGLRGLFQVVQKTLLDVIGFESVVLYVFDEHEQSLWTDNPPIGKMSIDLEMKCVLTHAFDIGENILLTDASSHPHFNELLDSPDGVPVRDMAVVPIVHPKRVDSPLGLLQVCNKREEWRELLCEAVVSEEDMLMLSALSLQLAAALHTAQIDHHQQLGSTSTIDFYGSSMSLPANFRRNSTDSCSSSFTNKYGSSGTLRDSSSAAHKLSIINEAAAKQYSAYSYSAGEEFPDSELAAIRPKSSITERRKPPDIRRKWSLDDGDPNDPKNQPLADAQKASRTNSYPKDPSVRSVPSVLSVSELPADFNSSPSATATGALHDDTTEVKMVQSSLAAREEGASVGLSLSLRQESTSGSLNVVNPKDGDQSLEVQKKTTPSAHHQEDPRGNGEDPAVNQGGLGENGEHEKEKEESECVDESPAKKVMPSAPSRRNLFAPREDSSINIVFREEALAACLNMAESEDVFAGVDLTDPSLNLLSFNTQQLNTIVLAMFQAFDLPRAFNIPIPKLERFIKKVANNYQSENHFHNWTHAVTVLHVIFVSLVAIDGINQFLSLLDVLALFIGALAHDVDHTGQNNSFHIQSASTLALRYNDRSVLEAHSAATLYNLITDPNINILSSLSKQDYSTLRVLVLAMILETDLAAHELQLSRLVGHLNFPFDRDAIEDRKLITSVILHAADLSNPTRPFDQAHQWSRLLAQEMMAQANLERSKNMQVAPFMEGLKDVALSAKGEIFFISTFSQPLWEAVAEIFPALRHRVETLQENLDAYVRVVENQSGEVVKRKKRNNLLTDPHTRRQCQAGVSFSRETTMFRTSVPEFLRNDTGSRRPSLNASIGDVDSRFSLHVSQMAGMFDRFTVAHIRTINPSVERETIVFPRKGSNPSASKRNAEGRLV